jgi:hypothetical protein
MPVTRRDIGPEVSAERPRRIIVGLSIGQRRALTKTERAIRVSDPRLAALMDIFSWLNRAEEVPPAERLAGRGRRRRAPRSRPGSRGRAKEAADAS